MKREKTNNVKSITKIFLPVVCIALLFLSSGCMEDKDISISYGSVYGSVYGCVHGRITDAEGVPLEGVSVILTGNNQTYTAETDVNGEYEINKIYPGYYVAEVTKEEYKKITKPDFYIVEYGCYPLNLKMWLDCTYYKVNTSVNFALRYGGDVKVYKCSINIRQPYPTDAETKIFPEPDGDLSRIETTYIGENRMLTWYLDNSDGAYSSVAGYLYIDMNGTRTMEIFSPTEMSIDTAAAEKPDYLGNQWLNKKDESRCMIEPSNAEIKEIANGIKQDANTENVWELAKEIFKWHKNHTYYERDVAEHTQSALEVLHSGKGDCDELSYLYISLCRAAGIPARFVKGYMVSPKEETDKFEGHVWAEFYDGEWVTVECAGNGSAQKETGWNFGIYRPNHIDVFFDDGTDASIYASLGPSRTWTYYDKPPETSSVIEWDSVEYDEMYLAVFPDGKRELKEEKE